MEQRNVLQRSRHLDHLSTIISLIRPPISPLLRPIPTPTPTLHRRLWKIDLPLCDIGQRHRRYQQSGTEHVLLRRDVRVHGCPVGDIRIREAVVHVQRPHDHSAGEVELVEDGFEVGSKLIAEVDVRLDDGGVLRAVGPWFVIASIGVLEVAIAGAVLLDDPD